MPVTYHATRNLTATALALLDAAATAQSRLVRRVLLRAADVAGVSYALGELDRGLQVTRRGSK